jgi:hypothetical protein
VLDGDDCAPGDAETWAPPATVTGLAVEATGGVSLTWDEQATVTGPSVRYDLITGLISELRSIGSVTAGSCLEGGLDQAAAMDIRPDPQSGDGYFYLVRAENPCVTYASTGDGRTLDDVTCSTP